MINAVVSHVVFTSPHKHPFNGLFPRTTWVSRYQKNKTILDFNKVRDDEVAVASVGRYTNHLHLAPDR